MDSMRAWWHFHGAAWVVAGLAGACLCPQGTEVVAELLRDCQRGGIYLDQVPVYLSFLSISLASVFALAARTDSVVRAVGLRLHLSTLMTLFLVSSVLMGMNIHGSGWPWDWSGGSENSPSGIADARFNLGWNLYVALSLLVTTAGLLESQLRPRESARVR
ncbi:MAG: hypothetical protein AMXMBFR7_47210 [Planctomycetota bacterium]